MWLLKQFILKNAIDTNTQKYALIRGLMQDIILAQSCLIRLRAGLNVFHVISVLGWEIFNFDGLCLYFETLTNTIIVSIRSFIDKLWRMTHNFFLNKDKKITATIQNEIPNCNKFSITSLERVYSIISTLHNVHKISPYQRDRHNFGLMFDFTNADTLFLINELRNNYIHGEPSPNISGVIRRDYITSEETPKRSSRYDIYISTTPLIKIKNLDNSGYKDFRKFLEKQGLDLSKLDYWDVLEKRILWRAPPEIQDTIKFDHFPDLYSSSIPLVVKEITHIEREEKGNMEVIQYFEHDKKILECMITQLKSAEISGYYKISLYNLSDCMWSLFDTLKTLLKVFLMKKLYNKEF